MSATAGVPAWFVAYFRLGAIAGTQHTRWAVLRGEHTVVSVQISRPDGVEVPRPERVRWKRRDTAEARLAAAVPSWNNVHGERIVAARQRAGEQARKVTWLRVPRQQGVPA